MTTISAKTILRSRHSRRPDKVLSTLLLHYPRFIHAEFMTHRQLSRNAASSRAIPFEKQLAAMKDDPAFPIFWGKNQKGMQAYEELSESEQVYAKGCMKYAMDCAIYAAEQLHKVGAHKQIVNRIIEPFTHIKVLASATEWSNFLALRNHPAAEPHIQILAKEIGRELDREDNIQILEPGAWHLPFWDHASLGPVMIADYGRQLKQAIAMSVACCASTSYKTVDGFDMTLEKAIELHDKLVGSTPLHASPAEHVAQADSLSHYERLLIKDDDEELLDSAPDWDHSEEHGNFVGFRQYRKQLPGECF